MKDFLQLVAEIVETESVSETDILTELPQWDSLTVLSLIASIRSKYGVELSGAALREAPTAGQLWNIIQNRRLI